MEDFRRFGERTGDGFGGRGANDAARSPQPFGAPQLPSLLAGDLYPYPAFLDDPGCDPGRADYEARAADPRQHPGWEVAALADAATVAWSAAGAGSTAGAGTTAGEALLTGAGSYAGAGTYTSTGSTAVLSPAAWTAAHRVREVDWLVDGLGRHRATEARAHADRARDVRRLSVLLGSQSENPVERSLAPSVTAAEIAATLSLPSRAARSLVMECLALTEPDAAPVLAALDDGWLDRERARAILHAAATIPANATEAFISAALDIARSGRAGSGNDVVAPSLSALRRSLRRLAQEHAEESLTVRARAAREHRRVDIEPGDDGMCHLFAYLPLEGGALIDTRLQAIARAQPAGDPRTIAQQRADALVALALGIAGASPGASAGSAAGASAGASTRADSGGGAVVDAPRGGVRMELVVVAPRSTVIPEPAPTSDSAAAAGCSTAVSATAASDGLELGDAPGEILGYGLVPAEVIRRMAARASTWLRGFSRGAEGAPLALGRTRYTPPAALRRYLAERDEGCRFPGCDVPHPHTEADHTLEWARGGATEPGNLALLCREHHRLKTLGYWSAEQDQDSGQIIWTSPLGRVYRTARPPGFDPPPPKPPPF